MKIINQLVLTIYEDGTTRITERSVSQRDDVTGRFVACVKPVVDDTPVFPEFDAYMREGGRDAAN